MQPSSNPIWEHFKHPKFTTLQMYSVPRRWLRQIMFLVLYFLKALCLQINKQLDQFRNNKSYVFIYVDGLIYGLFEWLPPISIEWGAECREDCLPTYGRDMEHFYKFIILTKINIKQSKLAMIKIIMII